MPKEKRSPVSIAKSLAELDKCLHADRGQLFCDPCGKMLSTDKKCNVESHLVSVLHQKNKEAWDRKYQTHLSGEASINNYWTDLCECFVEANIPLSKLVNKKLSTTLEKWTGKASPNESTLRKNYLPVVYKKTLSLIHEELKKGYLYFVVDESYDAQKRYIANLMVGTIRESGAGVPRLVACAKLDQTNNATVARFRLFPEGGFEDRILLALTDAAAYMILAMKNLKVFYPKQLHVTCLVHKLHNVSEVITGHYPLANTWISTVKQVFLKAPLRIELFHEMCPNIPLPPEPVMTRFGTWLEAAIYHCNNYEDVKKVIQALPVSKTKCVVDAKSMIENDQLELDLINLSSCYGFLVESIRKLETRGLPLEESVTIIEDVRQRLGSVRGERGKQISTYFQNGLAKNPGYNTLKTVVEILHDSVDDAEKPATLKDFTTREILALKYAQITSMDVERSFSIYKNFFTNKRFSFTMDNLEMQLIINCYANVGSEDDDV
ncbi:hypothetical protein B566_EDAN015985 [Ephemera danica]|nr:hypothetical protein B566_EDAN015985 [Ephemera danica]